MSSSKQTVLVIGANGKTGSRVVQRLRAAQYPVKAASRSSETPFDWNDETTWARALDGANAAYITYFPDLAFPGAADTVEAFVKLAINQGVRRLVLLSGRGEEGAQDAEQRLQKSGADWTIVRCSVFNQNFSESFADSIRQGHLAMPGGETLEPFVDAEDIADVVFAALTDDRHTGQLYELTGPRLISLADVAEELSQAIGREVQYHPVTVEEYAKDLVEHGFAEADAHPIAELISDVLDGRNARLADGVQRALGRPPRDFTDFAQDAANAGVWDLERVVTS